jgi:hypothetical protein
MGRGGVSQDHAHNLLDSKQFGLLDSKLFGLLDSKLFGSGKGRNGPRR